ncbi:MAG: winged helix-turn-helix domain-containing protein [Tepidiformaceae bacterium]
MPDAQIQTSPLVHVVSLGATLPDNLTASLVRLGATVIGRAYQPASSVPPADPRPDIVVAAVAPGSEEALLLLGALSRETRAFILACTDTDDDGLLCAMLDAGADATHSHSQAVHLFESRVRAVQRRSQAAALLATGPAAGIVIVRDFVVDFDRREVRRGDELIRLTTSEFDLLAFLARNGGRVIAEAAILERISIAPGYLRMCVRGLRIKLGDRRGRGAYIVNRRGAGYMLELAAPESDPLPFSRTPALQAV